MLSSKLAPWYIAKAVKAAFRPVLATLAASLCFWSVFNGKDEK